MGKALNHNIRSSRALNTTNKNWLWTPKTNQQARLIIYCFHQAGGSAQAFRLWGEDFAALAEIRAIQLPGRADRLSEPFIKRIPDLMKTLTKYFETNPPDRAFAFFGHSLGGLIAYELAQQLSILKLKMPLAVCLASRSAPHIKNHQTSIYNLGDDAFLEALAQRYGPSPGQEYLNDPEIREMFMPIMKADMELFESYEFASSGPLDIPIFAAYGDSDPAMSVANMQAWSTYTSKTFLLESFVGGHFFWMKKPSVITEPIKKFLLPLIS